MEMRITKKIFLGALLALTLAGCGEQGSGKPVLATSFYPIQYLASRIAGDLYEVRNLTPIGTEPHDLEITPSIRRSMEDAKLLFINGLGMEVWADSLTTSIRNKTVTLSDGLPTLQVEGRTDPHVWLDMDNYLKMGEAVLSQLCSIDSEHKDQFDANFASFREDLENEKAAHQVTAESFPEGKVIAVSHAAFGYLCNEWGIEQLYINKLSPDEEPTQSAINGIIDAVKTYGIDTIFFEELASDEVARFIAEKTGTKCVELNPLEGLSQEDIDAGEDYFSVYRDNMSKIAEAKP